MQSEGTGRARFASTRRPKEASAGSSYHPFRISVESSLPYQLSKVTPPSAHVGLRSIESCNAHNHQGRVPGSSVMSKTAPWRQHWPNPYTFETLRVRMARSITFV
jgi:hypothetical protein